MIWVGEVAFNGEGDSILISASNSSNKLSFRTIPASQAGALAALGFLNFLELNFYLLLVFCQTATRLLSRGGSKIQ